MPGPPRKPYHLKLAAGNPGHAKLNPGPEFTPGTTDPPKYLKREARALWISLATEFDRLGLWKEAYSSSLEGLCMNYQRAREADRDIAENGLTMPTLHGITARPTVKISHQAWAHVKQFCSEFGLTLASTSKITAPSKGKQSLSDMLG